MLSNVLVFFNCRFSLVFFSRRRLNFGSFKYNSRSRYLSIILLAICIVKCFNSFNETLRESPTHYILAQLVSTFHSHHERR